MPGCSKKKYFTAVF